MKSFSLFLSVFLFFICFIGCNNPESKKSEEKNTETTVDSPAVKLQLITTAVNAPVQMDVCPDNSHRLFITDLGGKIWILKNDSVQQKPFLDISDRLEKRDTNPEIKGLFSIAFHPQFSTNKKFYVCYNAPTKIADNICKLVISEFTANANDPDLADPKSEHRVFELEGKGVEMLASQIAFGPDGYLYISIGDHGDSSYKCHAQDLNYLNGKLLRIDVNKTPYAIPADNPFNGIKNERSEIWAYGFRRLWRFSFDPQTHQLFGGDVGEAKQEELDVITKGANYGWPIKEGDSSHDTYVQVSNEIYTSPINTYTHQNGICVIGGNFYYGNKIPFLKGKYVFADFTGNLFSLTKNNQGSWIRQPLKELNKPADPFFICSCNVDENDELYVMGLLNTKTGFKGVVYKIVRA